MAPPTQRESEQELRALYRDYQNDPGSVSEQWRASFDKLAPEAAAWLAADVPAQPQAEAPPVAGKRSGARDEQELEDLVAARALIRAFRSRGHFAARLDPLGLAPTQALPDLQPDHHGFTSQDLDRPIYLGGELGLERGSVSEVLATLRRTYCGTIALEYAHLQSPSESEWLQERFESLPERAFKPEKRRELFEQLTRAEGFERFIDKRWKGAKRFGLDGAESTIAALEEIVQRGGEQGVQEIVIGMPHRGRLNVLANIMGKPLHRIFSEFRGLSALPDDVAGSGDVKYHLGTSSDRQIEGQNLHLSLVPNPSHLEAVNPVVCGKVRARQEQLADEERTRCLGILLHGDAAFAGQGLVAEVLQLSELEGYTSGGTIHLIVNNQVGFTTNPSAARSGPYCSDMAKLVQAPILHVNGDDPEAVANAAGLALEFRQRFHRDVVIDLVCYRRFGHNEGDEPAFTQPRMVAAIKAQETTRTRYAAMLCDEGVLDGAEVEAAAARWHQELDAAYDASEQSEPGDADWLGAHWSGLEAVKGFDARRGQTGVEAETLREIGALLTRVPEGFHLNRKIDKQLRAKRTALESGEGIDWATAEALALGSLLLEGHGVRLSGEDVNRGTFSHRHAGWTDQEDETRYAPLEHLSDQQGPCSIVNSPLSEFGVLGFEYGYAMAEPGSLVVWEAQFGDFANGAQVVIDQFLAAGESKWLRMSGLVLLLPHGYEGQGPEHSSARLERFLQLCGEDNLQVVNCTTPANYFHVLRRQLHRSFRKPLVVMAPKSLLRHKRVVSDLASMGAGSEFHRVLHCDQLPSPRDEAKQVVLCSGKIYYELLEAREKRGAQDVHLLRIEQLYPFPSDALRDELASYRHCRLVWCQEEPRNMGAWSYIAELIEEVARDVQCEDPKPRYAGRVAAASPATGNHGRHREEQEQLIDDAFDTESTFKGRLASRRERG